MTQKRDPRGRGLGRGLSALLGDVEPERAVEAVPSPDPAPVAVVAPAPRTPQTVAIDTIAPNPDQPRRRFIEADLSELAASIRERGIIQPLILRPDPNTEGRYQIVAGERRWRAAQIAELHEVPAIVREIDDATVLEVAIIENVQRADLTPIEEAQGYAQLIETFAYTQEALARIVGKSRSHLANTLRLLSLPEAVRALLASGELSAGHARALIGASDPVALARETVEKGLTVRQVEQLAKKRVAPPAAPRRAPPRDADTRMLEGDLSAAIGMKVQIRHSGPEGSGELRIRYRDLDDLDRLCQRLGE
ncbi:MAG: ParB/RepB/Spo0J family partition protein [Pseudomonadota bacterium]